MKLKFFFLNKILLLAALALVFNLLLPTVVFAQTTDASLYFSPASGTYGLNGKFTIAVKVDTAGAIINAVEGSIVFDNKILEVVSLSKSGSTLSLWTTEPNFNNTAGTISFGGGTPMPGYKGNGGLILNISFKTKAVSDATAIRFSSGAVLANDGKGTNVLSSLGSASFIISPKEITPLENGAETPAATGPEYNKPAISSPSQPDQNAWYKENTVLLKWDIPEGVNAISFGFGKEPLTEPDVKSSEIFLTKEYKDVPDGLWYFHLKFKDDKKWGTTAHYRVMIDTQAPELFNIKVNQGQVGDWPTFELGAQDSGSGLLKYQIMVGSLENVAYELGPEENIFKPVGLSAGEHTALIMAIDKAGNEKSETVKFTIEPIEAPQITKFSERVNTNDKFFITGTSIPNAAIKVNFLQDGSLIASSTAQSDAKGVWFYVHSQSLPNGRYVAWAEATNSNGVPSNQSNKISFLVSPPIFVQIGSWVINYFTVVVSLAFMIILIVVGIMLLARLVKRRLKKETFEVDYVLHRNIVDLNELIDEEFNDLNKIAGTSAYNKERVKIKQKIKNYIVEAELKIMKEIKDIEKILK